MSIPKEKKLKNNQNNAIEQNNGVRKTQPARIYRLVHMSI